MGLTGTKHIRGLKTLEKTVLFTTQAQTKKAFDYSKFKTLELPTSKRSNLFEKDVHLPKREYAPKAHTSSVTKDDNEKELPGGPQRMAKGLREQCMREFLPDNGIQVQ